MKLHHLFLTAACLVPSLDAAPITYAGSLLGSNENPVVVSPGSGFVTVTIDPVAHTMVINASFSGLIGTTTAAHIHCCQVPPTNAGVATQTPSFVGFPLGVTSGTFFNSFDTSLASTYNPAFVTANGGLAGAETAFFNGLAAGQAYFNVHTSFAGGGEIRANLVAIPEPGTFGMMAGAALLLFVAQRFRRI